MNNSTFVKLHSFHWELCSERDLRKKFETKKKNKTNETNDRKRNNTSDSDESDETESMQDTESNSTSNSNSSDNSSSTTSSSDEEESEAKQPEVKVPETRSRPENKKIMQTRQVKNKASTRTTFPKQSEKGLSSGRNEKERYRDNRSRQVWNNTKSYYRDHPQRNYGCYGNDRQRGRVEWRDNRSYRNRDWETRDEEKIRISRIGDLRNRITGRLRARERVESRERGRVRSRSREGYERSRDTREVRNNDIKRRKEKETKRSEVREPEEPEVNIEEELPNTLEYKTVGALLQAALERCLQRKIIRGS